MKFDDLPNPEMLRLLQEAQKLRDILPSREEQRIIDEMRSQPRLEGKQLSDLVESQKQYIEMSKRRESMFDMFSGGGYSQNLLREFGRIRFDQPILKILRELRLPEARRSILDAYRPFIASHWDQGYGTALNSALRFWRNNNAAFQSFQPHAFASSLVEYVRASAPSTTLSDEAILQLEVFIEAKVAELPRSRITAEALIGIIAIVVSVILFFANIVYLEYKESQQVPRDQGLTQTQIERIAAAIEKSQTLVPLDDTSKYYVVQRQVCIRVRPNDRSAAIATLYPNQKVRLETLAHQWIYVEYFDYIEGIPKFGWVNKKYLEKLG